MATEPPVVFIIGPTASGKTSLAVDLAKRCGGEIICADSRTVYKYMDIGTAKPSAEDQKAVPHWGLDLVEPGARFTASDFKLYAQEKIRDIRTRGRIPFVVGGTGLYINAVLYDYKFNNSFDQEKRQKLEQYTVDELHEYCLKNNILLPKNQLNKRYIIRSIEKNTTQIIDSVIMIEHACIVGISPGNKDKFYARIRNRIEQLFEDGVVEEATMLGNIYGWNNEAMTGNIYRLVRQHLDGSLSFAELKERAAIVDRQLAKRQLTWFRRDKNVQWHDLEAAKKYLENILSEYISCYDENNKVIGVTDD